MKNVKALILLIVSLIISACTPAAALLQRDLKRTVELAERYGKPEVAQCAQYLSDALSKDQGLLAEGTDGLVSAAFKLYLLTERRPQDEAAFKAKCGSVAAGVLLEVIRRR